MSVEIIVLIVILGLIFDYTNGFHDAANVVSTVIATGALRPFVAILMAGIFNALGATQISGVAQTISTGLVEASLASQSMILAALAGAIFWNLATWYFGVPSSSSYALIGGLMGAALVAGGSSIIIWKGLVFKVVIPMLVSPVIGFCLAFALMKLLFKLGHRKKESRLFSHLQIISAAAVALAHGLNDAQKSMGIITLGLFAAGLIGAPVIPFWVIMSCALVMGLGTASGGFRIIRTVGFEITKLHPIHGFAAEMSSSFVILAASFLGMPISSSHLITGSVTGVGTARGAGAVHWATAHKVIVAWFLTLPGAALVAALVSLFLNFFDITI